MATAVLQIQNERRKERLQGQKDHVQQLENINAENIRANAALLLQFQNETSRIRAAQQEEIRHLNKQVDELRSTVSGLQRSLAEESEKNLNLVKQNALLTMQIDELKEQNEELRAINNQFKQKIVSLEELLPGHEHALHPFDGPIS